MKRSADEDDRAPDADFRVGWHEGHQEGGDAHQQQRGDERCLASHPVAVMAEDRRTHGPRHEADRIDAEGLQRPDQRIGMRKVELREGEARHNAIEEEIVPLDGGADGAGDHRAAELAAVFGLGEQIEPVLSGCHEFLPY